MDDYQIKNGHTAHASVDEAKVYAVNHIGYWDHAYIYQCGEEITLMWHSEDRYVTSYMPFNAKILWHGEITRGDNGQRNGLAWERRGNHNADDFNVIADALGYDTAKTFKDMGILDMDLNEEKKDEDHEDHH